MTRRSFRSMGCEIVVGGAGDEALAAIAALFSARDRTFSRFRRDSELTRVNRARGPLVAASPPFLRAVRVALEAARATGGLVDPTVGAAVEAAGYDRDSSLLPADDPRPAAAASVGDWRRIRVGERLVVRPPGTTLDLNGVVKSLAVDDAVALLDGPGFVAAGGDLATRGGPVVVALPDGGSVTLEAGGIATSGTATRRWRRAGELQHHLIDPRTGRPSRSPWRLVTAVGATCLAADVAAKAGFLLGEEGPAWLDARGVAARFVSDDGIVENRRWAAALAAGREAA